MCGIAGAIALEPGRRPDADRLRRMSAQIAHRGPDGEGVWSDPTGRVTFAHRRLSVIDLETGQQPMSLANDSVTTVFNGEIYNYRELRDALRRDGMTFRTDSDTEVLLALLARDGEGALESLRGMFAFAAWDAKRERLLLARDRVGKKPLYYVIEDGCLYFASALRALHASTPHRWSIDLEAVDAYLTLGYIPAPATIFRDVRKLEAGCTLAVSGSTVSGRRFWDLAEEDEPFDGSFDAAVDRAEEILESAVSIRLRSDVPLGVFLSGGIDSSLVAATAARVSPTPIRTFSIGFDHADFDESRYSSAVAAHLGTEHRLFRVHADVLALIPRLADHYGEPFGDSSAIPSWILAENTRPHVTVALNGDGGDEGFAGYRWYETARRLSRLGRMLPAGAAAIGSRALAGVGGGTTGPARRMAQIGRGLSMVALRGEGERFAALRSFMNPSEAAVLYAGALADLRAGDPSSSVTQMAELYERCEGTSLRRMRYADMRFYLADCLLPKVDVATMAHGLEGRSPLLDQELVRFAMSLPDEYLVGPGGGKRVLRALLARHVPSELFERPKQGFSLPLAPWFAGPLRSRVDALATSEPLLSHGWLRPDGIRRTVEEHVAGTRDHSQRLYSLIMLDEWLRQH